MDRYLLRWIRHSLPRERRLVAGVFLDQTVGPISVSAVIDTRGVKVMFRILKQVGIVSLVTTLVFGFMGIATPAIAQTPTDYEGASEIVASIRGGTCEQPDADAKWDVVDETDEYRGVQLPVVGKESKYPVVHEDATLNITMDDVKGLIIIAQNKPESPTATICGEIGGTIFDEKLAVAMRPVDGSQAGGLATFHITTSGKLYVMVYFVENMSGK